MERKIEIFPYLISTLVTKNRKESDKEIGRI